MDGKELVYRLRNILNESSDSAFLDSRTAYMFLWEAAKAFVGRTNYLKGTQSITTVANQSDYTLNADFMKLYLKSENKEFLIKYNDGSDNTFLQWKDYDSIVYEDNTDSVSKPSFFTLLNDTQDSIVTGTASASGAVSNGVCTLSDTSSSTKFADVSAGDIVHNTSDGADGIVLSKTSNTALVTALFGGSGNDWASADAYIIQPQGRMKLVLSPPPLTAGHTITLYYVQIPPPVFSLYGIYSLPQQAMDALVKYAAWLFKYRDRELDYGDKWYGYFERQMRNMASVLRDTQDKNKLNVSFKRR